MYEYCTAIQYTTKKYCVRVVYSLPTPVTDKTRMADGGGEGDKRYQTADNRRKVAGELDELIRQFGNNVKVVDVGSDLERAMEGKNGTEIEDWIYTNFPNYYDDPMIPMAKRLIKDPFYLKMWRAKIGWHQFQPQPGSNAQNKPQPVSSAQNKREPGSSAQIEPKDTSLSKQATEQRFKVTRFKGFVRWSWDLHTDNCAICRNPLMDFCIECQARQVPITDEDCMPAWGECNHAYHYHCISRWLNSRSVCPLDSMEWMLKRVGR